MYNPKILLSANYELLPFLWIVESDYEFKQLTFQIFIYESHLLFLEI